MYRFLIAFGISVLASAAASQWVGSDNGTDTVFTNLVNGSGFTLLGVTGVAISDILPGANQSPQAGSRAVAFIQDVSALSDFVSNPGDMVIFTATDLPDGFALSDAGILTQTDSTQLSAVGIHLARKLNVEGIAPIP